MVRLPNSTDPELVHAWRTSIRRLRILLAICSDALLAAGPLNDELRVLARSLSGVRDLDVLIARVEAWGVKAQPDRKPAYTGVLQLLRAARSRAWTEMVQALEEAQSEQIEVVAHLAEAGLQATPAELRAQLVQAMAPLLDESPEWVATVVREAAPAFIKQQWRRARRRPIDYSSAAALHRLRIRCKRVRYALELTADLVGPTAQPFIKRLLDALDVLGQHEDAHVGMSILRELRREAGRQPAEVDQLLKVIRQRYARTQRRLRGRAARAIQAFDGKPSRQLAQALRTQAESDTLAQLTTELARPGKKR